MASSIRAVRPEDIERVCEIAVAAWEPIYAGFRQLLGDTLFALAHHDWRTEKASQVRWACRNEPWHVVVTELDGEVVGFLSYRLDEARSMGEIGNNAVHPGFQGRGIGAAQCAHALEAFRQQGLRCASVWTGLDDSHAPARAMYQKAGFDRALPGVQYWQEL